MADHQDSPKRQKTSCLQCRNPQKKRAHTCEKGMNRGRGSQRGGRMNSRGGSSNRGGRGGSRGGSSRVGGSKRKRHKKDDHLDSEDEAYHSHNAAPTGSTEVTRRSSRASKSTVKYTFDSDEFDEEDSSDEEDEQGNKITKIEMQENPVESIMGKREAEDGTTEWFVKWKEKSYIHACWVREEVFEPYRDFRMNGKMTRLNNKIENNTDITSTINYDDEMTLFDQEFLVVDEIIGHDEEWVTIDETAAAAAAAAALELEHAKKATENKNAAIILEQEKEKEMPEHPQPPFIDSFLHPTYICPTCGYILEDITYHGVLYESSIPTYTQACPHCERSHSYSDYDVVFRGQRIGMMLNHKTFREYKSNLVCYIEKGYDPTELHGDEDEQFHQDDAARVSMKVSDIIVGIKEMEPNEKKDETSSSTSSTSSSSTSTTTDTTATATYQIGSRFTVKWDVSKSKSDQADWQLYNGTVLRSATIDDKTARATEHGEPLSALDWVDVAWKVKYDGNDEKEYLEYERDMTYVKVKAIPYRELFVTSGVAQADLVDAIRTWRRPIIIKMRRPKPIRSIRRRKNTSRYAPSKSFTNSSGGSKTSPRGSSRGRKLQKIDWFLVKWTNMSFKFVSWEKKQDINDDLAIAKFKSYQTIPTQSRTDEKRKDEVKKSYYDNGKKKFAWESNSNNNLTQEEGEVANVLADLIKRIACRPMLADGWSLLNRDETMRTYQTTNWIYKNEVLGLTSSGMPLGRGVFHNYTTSPDFKNGLELRSYQVEGLNWLLRSWYAERGSILADEMGKKRNRF